MSEYFIGIDSGTQSTKTILLDAASGEVVASASESYELIEGLPAGHKEQHPAQWIAAAYETIKAALDNGVIDRAQFDLLAVAINTGTNIPSVATPNGQAAFLFLLTSALAPLIRLSYMRMVVMALPYTVVLTATGLLAVIYLL